MKDPIADMMNMLKNAGNAGKPTITIPHSKHKLAIAKCLKDQGYLASIEEVKNKNGIMSLTLGVAYSAGLPKIKHVDRVSKTSRRVYSGVDTITNVRQGQGIVVLSTPKGILSGKDAKTAQVGGEVLFNIW